MQFDEIGTKAKKLAIQKKTSWKNKPKFDYYGRMSTFMDYFGHSPLFLFQLCHWIPYAIGCFANCIVPKEKFLALHGVFHVHGQSDKNSKKPFLASRYVANELKAGHRVPPEMIASASILFSNIVGFTRICQQSTPLEVVNLLNGIYAGFDEKIHEFGAYKVETIGDAYMVVAGVPPPKDHAGTAQIRHVESTAHIALAMRTVIPPTGLGRFPCWKYGRGKGQFYLAPKDSTRPPPPSFHIH